MISSINATYADADDLPKPALALLRSARIDPVGSDLEEDLALRTPDLLRAVSNHWNTLASGAVDTERMKKALSRLAVEILRRDDGAVPLDWVRSHLLRGVKAKEKLRAVAGGVKQLFGQRSQAMQDVQEGFQQADQLPVQLVEAAQSYGILRLVRVAGEPDDPWVRFTHDALLYAFGALHDLTPRLLWTGLDDSGETLEERRLYLAKLSLLDADDLSDGLGRVAEKNLDVAAAFLRHDGEAMRREGEAVAEKYFQRIEWETWRADVEAAEGVLESFGDAAARVARAWARKALEDDEAHVSDSSRLVALPLAVAVLGRHGRAMDLAVLRRVERQASELGRQRLKRLYQNLESAQKALDNWTTSQQKAKRTGKKVAASVLTVGMTLLGGAPPTSGGAALGQDYRDRESELRQKTWNLSHEIEALESNLEELRQRVATSTRDAIAAIEQRTG